MAQPQSRAEAIVRATIDGETYEGLPQSRLEALLIELNHHGGGGGGGSYEDLTDLPTFNGQTLEGDVTGVILSAIEPLNPDDEEELKDIITDDHNGN